MLHGVFYIYLHSTLSFPENGFIFTGKLNSVYFQEILFSQPLLIQIQLYALLCT